MADLFTHGWSAENAKLTAKRGIGFEDIVFHTERGDLLEPALCAIRNRQRSARIAG